MFFPVIESSQFIAFKPSCSFTGNPHRIRTTANFVQAHCDALADLGNRDRRRQWFAMKRFLDQKPKRHQRKRLMMMPARPGTDFIIAKPRLTFSALQRILNPTVPLSQPVPRLQEAFESVRWKESSRASKSRLPLVSELLPKVLPSY